MRLPRNYWVYSAAFVGVWIVIALIASLVSSSSKIEDVAAGALIGWVSCTIARHVYPPPKRWLKR